MLIPPEVMCISKICDVTATRYALGGVHLTRGGADCPTAVSCDGRRMIVVTWDDRAHMPDYPGAGGTEVVENYSTIIPKKQWDEAAKLGAGVAKSKKADIRFVAVDEKSTNGKVQMSTYDGETTRVIGCPTLEGRYPDWKGVVPTFTTLDKQVVKDAGLEDMAVEVRLNHAFLAEVAKLVHEAAGLGDDKPAITLRVPLGQGKAVLLEATGANVVMGILMPCND